MRIVIIDDSPIDRKHFSQALNTLENAEVLALESLDGNLQSISEHQPELVVLDDRLSPIVSADDSLRTISEHFPNIPVVVMSGDVGPSRRSEVIRQGAFDCLEKDDMDTAAMDLIVAMAELRGSVFRPSARNGNLPIDRMTVRPRADGTAVDQTNST